MATYGDKESVVHDHSSCHLLGIRDFFGTLFKQLGVVVAHGKTTPPMDKVSRLSYLGSWSFVSANKDGMPPSQPVRKSLPLCDLAVLFAMWWSAGGTFVLFLAPRKPVSEQKASRGTLKKLGTAVYPSCSTPLIPFPAFSTPEPGYLRYAVVPPVQKTGKSILIHPFLCGERVIAIWVRAQDPAFNISPMGAMYRLMIVLRNTHLPAFASAAIHLTWDPEF